MEFRPFEVQLTDFENASLAIIVVLIARSILAMGYNFYLPISLVEENMRRAERNDAVNKEKFYIQRNSLQSGNAYHIPEVQNSDIIELSLDEIFNGKESAKGGFPGIIPSVKKYLNSLGCNSPVKAKLSPYLELISKRAAGTLPTAAQWMRNYVKSHPEYISNLEELLHAIDTNKEISDIDKIYEKIVKKFAYLSIRIQLYGPRKNPRYK